MRNRYTVYGLIGVVVVVAATFLVFLKLYPAKTGEQEEAEKFYVKTLEPTFAFTIGSTAEPVALFDRWNSGSIRFQSFTGAQFDFDLPDKNPDLTFALRKQWRAQFKKNKKEDGKELAVLRYECQEDEELSPGCRKGTTLMLLGNRDVKAPDRFAWSTPGKNAGTIIFERERDGAVLIWYRDKDKGFKALFTSAGECRVETRLKVYTIDR